MKGLLFELFTLALYVRYQKLRLDYKMPKFTDKQIGINTNWKSRFSVPYLEPGKQ